MARKPVCEHRGAGTLTLHRPEASMNSYPLQMQHNAWANHVVYAGFEGHEPLIDAVQYDHHPLGERLHHLAAVERGFATVLQGAARERPDPPRELEPLLA